MKKAKEKFDTIHGAQATFLASLALVQNNSLPGYRVSDYVIEQAAKACNEDASDANRIESWQKAKEALEAGIRNYLAKAEEKRFHFELRRLEKMRVHKDLINQVEASLTKLASHVASQNFGLAAAIVLYQAVDADIRRVENVRARLAPVKERQAIEKAQRERLEYQSAAHKSWAGRLAPYLTPVNLPELKKDLAGVFTAVA